MSKLKNILSYKLKFIWAEFGNSTWKELMVLQQAVYNVSDELEQAKQEQKSVQEQKAIQKKLDKAKKKLVWYVMDSWAEFESNKICEQRYKYVYQYGDGTDNRTLLQYDKDVKEAKSNLESAQNNLDFAQSQTSKQCLTHVSKEDCQCCSDGNECSPCVVYAKKGDKLEDCLYYKRELCEGILQNCIVNDKIRDAEKALKSATSNLEDIVEHRKKFINEKYQKIKERRSR